MYIFDAFIYKKKFFVFYMLCALSSTLDGIMF